MNITVLSGPRCGFEKMSRRINPEKYEEVVLRRGKFVEKYTV